MELLRSATSPAWLEVALAGFGEVLVDHAHCERKAAASAMSLASGSPEHVELVRRCIGLAQEPELRSFYRTLAQAEAGHARLFVELAGLYAPPGSVPARLESLSRAEAELVASLPLVARIH